MDTIKYLFVIINFMIYVCNGQYPSFKTYCQAPPVVPSQNTSNKTLQFLQILVRHGDRTPTGALTNEVTWNCTLNSLNLPSNDLYNHEESPKRLYRKTYLPGREVLPGNCMLGQLTEIGLEQHLEMGAQFRKLYIDEYQFLPEKLRLKDLWVRSTDVPRTLQSVSANLWGMYPPETREDGHTGIINIHTMDNYMDDMTPNSYLCPKYGTVLATLQNSTQWHQNDENFAALYSQLQKIFNTTGAIPSWGYLFDNMGARYCHNKELPNGIDYAMLQEIYNAIAWQNEFTLLNPELAKLGSGQLLGEIYQRIEDHINGIELPLLVFYSGHDSTVGPLMGLFGYYNGWPPYASHIEIELWSSNNGKTVDYFVQIKYNGIVYQLPGCSDVMCEYSQFQQVMNQLVLTNVQQECSSS